MTGCNQFLGVAEAVKVAGIGTAAAFALAVMSEALALKVG
jgi:hypothetical protein